MLLSLLFINVSFGFINNLSGWSYYQVLAVVGSYMITEGVMWVFFGQLNAINRHILDGTLDGVLLKPIDDQFYASFWRGDWEDFVRIITGLTVIIIAIKNTIGFNFNHLFLFVALLFNGIIMLYNFNLIVRSVSFWVIDGTGLWLLMERITSNSQYPTDIYYHKVVRGIMTFVIPIAFVATVPAKILTNNIIDWQLVILSFLMMVIFFLISRWFWKFSLKHYASASS
ncbi:MAG: ABC-2 family transporter protein [Candidatus Moranbacteria bacterium]|nr:ABC-2 family transporter protein [Candidatus Moranbacteria bacterium]